MRFRKLRGSQGMYIHRLAGRPVKAAWRLAYRDWSETADGFRKVTHEVLARRKPDSALHDASRHLIAAYTRFRQLEEDEALYQEALTVWRQAAEIYDHAVSEQLQGPVPRAYILRLRAELTRTRAALDLFAVSSQADLPLGAG
jgi:hypothetical protein